MDLQKLLDPEVFGKTLIGLGLLWYIDSRAYLIFKDTLSNLKDVFENAQFYSDNMDEYLLEGKVSGDELNILNSMKQRAIERYESILDKSVPKFLLFSRPFFYFQAKKEFNYMKEESKKRLNELEAA